MFIEVVQVVALGDRDLVRFQTEYGMAWALWERPGVVQRRQYDVEFADSRVHSWGDSIAVAGDGSCRIWEEGDLVCFGGVLEHFNKAMADVPKDADLSTLRIGYSIFMAMTRGEPPPVGTPVVVKAPYWEIELYDTGT